MAIAHGNKRSFWRYTRRNLYSELELELIQSWVYFIWNSSDVSGSCEIADTSLLIYFLWIVLLNGKIKTANEAPRSREPRLHSSYPLKIYKFLEILLTFPSMQLRNHSGVVGA